MIHVAVAHDLPQDEALRRVQELLRRAGKKYQHVISGVREEWNGGLGTFHVSIVGFPVSGTITVRDDFVNIVSAELPFALRIFQKKIDEAIRAEAARVLSAPS